MYTCTITRTNEIYQVWCARCFDYLSLLHFLIFYSPKSFGGGAIDKNEKRLLKCQEKFFVEKACWKNLLLEIGGTFVRARVFYLGGSIIVFQRSKKEEEGTMIVVRIHLPLRLNFLRIAGKERFASKNRYLPCSR